MTKKILTKVVTGILFFFLGSFSTITYFRYRSRNEFIPHVSSLTGMNESEVVQLEVFEWPLDILFPLIPFVIIICLVYLVLTLVLKVK